MKRKNITGLITTAAIIGLMLYLLYTPNPVTKAPIAPLLTSVTRGESIVRIAGDSMEPTMSNGDIAAIRNVPFNTLKVDDIILIQAHNKKKAIKRITTINSDGSLQTKSNNRPNPENITEKNYLGKVVKISHKDGTITTLP